MTDPLVQLQHEHTAREFQRTKIRAPIIVVTVLIIIASVITALLMGGVVRPGGFENGFTSPGLAAAIALGGRHRGGAVADVSADAGRVGPGSPA